MSFSRKRDRLVIILIILIPVAAISGWFLSRAANINYNNGEPQFFSIEGSSTVYKIIDVTSKAFVQTHPGVTISVTGSGTGSGITALIDGLADIAMASRPYEASEQTAANGSLKAVAFAKDALSIVIHASADPLDLTVDVARAIFNGTIVDWSHPLVAAANLTGTIQVVVRESGSGTRDTFNDLIMGDSTQLEPGSQYVSSAIQKSSNQLIKDAVATNPNYIGYIGLGYIDETVDAVTINGIEPTIENVINESYFIQRELFLITLGIPNGIVWQFISWSISPEGQDLVLESGFINAFPTSNDVYT